MADNDFRALAEKANEAFAAISLVRDFHSSGDRFQQEFSRVVGHLRERGHGLVQQGSDPHAGKFFLGIADALELWNYGEVRGGEAASEAKLQRLARELLQVLSAADSNEHVRMGAALSLWAKRGGSSADFDEALAEAVGRRWMETDGASVWLTLGGVRAEEMVRSSGPLSPSDGLTRR
jgi:hypothetical protein